MKQPKIIQVFLLSAGIVLLMTAVAKLVSAAGSARVLDVPSPILLISFRHLFLLVGAMELAVAIVCFFSKQVLFQSWLLAGLITNFTLYRFSLHWVGYHKPCSCLGNLTDELHISPQTADVAMKIILVYLLIGSYSTLFWLWRQHRQAASGSSDMCVGG